ncbi:MAG: DUF4238 domain-containing protein [Patescibacteria group bacterium]|jgi:hypothetical protein|nr:DUF4238 domain-containing protein [Patescibacteria group bacterium]
MKKNKTNFLIWFFYKTGNKFRNLVFRKRLGRKRWSAKLIIFIMSFFDFFQTRVYLNTGEVNKFDHYVPRLLLNRWRIAESGTDKGQLYCWSKNKAMIEKTPIKSVAGEIDWEVASANGEPSDFVRKKLFAELLEDKASSVIKIINTTDNLDLTYLEESTLAVFIGHQITRVPLFHEYLLRFFSIGYSKGLITYNDLGNKEVLTKKVANNEIGITYDQLLKNNIHTRVSGGKPQKLLLSLVIASDVGEKINRGNLHILEIPQNSNDEFVISDNPVIFLDFERQSILHFVPWWEIGKKDFWIFMPISPRKAIFYCCKSKKKDGPIENNNNDLVQLLNFGQYLCCTDNVFSRNINILESHLKLYSKELHNLNKNI